MIPVQLLRNCLQELQEICGISICLQDTQGNVLAEAGQRKLNLKPEELEGLLAFPENVEPNDDRCCAVIEEDGLPVYILTADGTAAHSEMAVKMGASELRNLLSACKEKNDRGTFLLNLLLDRLQPNELYTRAGKLRIERKCKRCVILIESEQEEEAMAVRILSGIFSVQNGDYLIPMGPKRIVLIKEAEKGAGYDAIRQAAAMAVDLLKTEGMMKARAAFGNMAEDLSELPRSCKEAETALEIGSIFYSERYAIAYGELGVGRLIYQLPTELCELFIREIFGENVEKCLNQETLSAVTSFFENNLNVSETARKLFVHRNTLVYRLDRLQSETGLDIRKVDDALTLKVAIMVVRYMNYMRNR